MKRQEYTFYFPLWDHCYLVCLFFEMWVVGFKSLMEITVAPLRITKEDVKAGLRGPADSSGMAGFCDRCWGKTAWDFPPGGLSSRKVTIVGNSFPATSSQSQQTTPLWPDWGHPSSFLFSFLEFVEQFLSGGIREWWSVSPFTGPLRTFLRKQTKKDDVQTIIETVPHRYARLSSARVRAKISPVYMLSLCDCFCFRYWHFGFIIPERLKGQRHLSFVSNTSTYCWGAVMFL